MSQANSVAQTPRRSPSGDLAHIQCITADQAAYKLSRMELNGAIMEPAFSENIGDRHFGTSDSVFSSVPVSRDGWSASMAAKNDLLAFQAERKERREARKRALEDAKARDQERLSRLMEEAEVEARDSKLKRKSSTSGPRGASASEALVSLRLSQVSNPNRSSTSMRSPGVESPATSLNVRMFGGIDTSRPVSSSSPASQRGMDVPSSPLRPTTPSITASPNLPAVALPTTTKSQPNTGSHVSDLVVKYEAAVETVVESSPKPSSRPVSLLLDTGSSPTGLKRHSSVRTPDSASESGMKRNNSASATDAGLKRTSSMREPRTDALKLTGLELARPASPVSPQISNILANLLKHDDAPKPVASSLHSEKIPAAAHVDDIKAKFEAAAESLAVANANTKRSSVIRNSTTSQPIQVFSVAVAENPVVSNEPRMSKATQHEPRLSLVIAEPTSNTEQQVAASNKPDDAPIDSATADLANNSIVEEVNDIMGDVPQDIELAPLESPVEPMAEPIVESVIEPIVEPVAESVTESIVESIVEPVEASVQSVVEAPVAVVNILEPVAETAVQAPELVESVTISSQQQPPAAPKRTTVICYAKASHPFEGNAEGNELTFAAGDVFEILEQDEGWWQARRYGTNQVGFLPSAYTQPITLDEIEQSNKPTPEIQQSMETLGSVTDVRQAETPEIETAEPTQIAEAKEPESVNTLEDLMKAVIDSSSAPSSPLTNESFTLPIASKTEDTQAVEPLVIPDAAVAQVESSVEEGEAIPLSPQSATAEGASRTGSASPRTGPQRRPPSASFLKARADSATASNQNGEVASDRKTIYKESSEDRSVSASEEPAPMPETIAPKAAGARLDRNKTITATSRATPKPSSISKGTSLRIKSVEELGTDNFNQDGSEPPLPATLFENNLLSAMTRDDEELKQRPTSFETSILSIMGNGSSQEAHKEATSPTGTNWSPAAVSSTIAERTRAFDGDAPTGSKTNLSTRPVSSLAAPSVGKYGRAVARREVSLLKVKGKRKMYTVRVPISAASMNEGDVFILEVPRTDSGMVFTPSMNGDPNNASLFVWYGKDAGPVKRAKGKEVVYRTQDREWGKKGVIAELEQGVENFSSAEFWRVIAGSPSAPSTMKTAVEGGDDMEYEKQMESMTFLYGADPESDPSNPQFKVLVNGKTLTTKNVHCGGSFIVDCYDEIFVWHGRQSPESERNAATAFAESLSKAEGRPANVVLDIERDPAERILFKERFMDWTDGFKIEVSLQKNIAAKDKSRYVYDRGGWDVKKIDKVNVEAMYDPPGPPSRWDVVEDPDIGGPPKPEEDLGVVSLEVLVLEEKGTSKSIDATEAQILYAGESYTFMYKHLTGRPESPKEVSVMYYWIGSETKSSDMANAAYTAADIAKKAGARQVRVRQGQEPSHFLKMLGGFVIVRKGFRKSFIHEDKALYHIRAVCRDVVRCEETIFNASSLSSAHCFVLALKNQVIVWHGVGSFDYEQAKANEVAKRIADVRPIQEIQEQNEPKIWFEKLAPNSTRKTPEYASADYFSLKSKFPDSYKTRLFRISFGLKNGNPTAEEVENYTQNDLEESAVFILDAFFEMFVWVGSEAKSNFKDVKLGLETCMEYVSYVAKKQPQRRIDGTKCLFVRSGAEPANFRTCFTAYDDGAEDFSESQGFLKKFRRTLSRPKGDAHKGALQLVPEILVQLRTTTYPIELLKKKDELPPGVDPNRIEDFMSPEDLQKVFKMDKDKFSALPLWKRTELKKKAGLF
ncbi:hypothetical protein SmJEL517_g05708 [Synchytrium microbalum]|uniref:HP domain-containing protein n=1 Tax=Synchytrium microbalum TaxID=1806994 RepID=A0A507BZV1_9FUNG|nr:uncharacterized protein SmJEL517_g05708 [Synchytrium microbalum]TPX30793.1 hypothetical protein SmJEL517_g05708 [Synchytrium microbalum]